MLTPDKLEQNTRILAVPMFALLFAILPLPYGYYTLLRILITVFSLFIMYLELNEEDHEDKNKWLLLFGFLVLIYNPIVPIHLSKLVWIIINLGSFAIFVSYKQHLETTVAAAVVHNNHAEEVEFSKAVNDFIVSAGLSPENVFHFASFIEAQKAYFDYKLIKGDDIVLGCNRDNLVIQKFQPRLGQNPSSFMEKFATAQGLDLDYTYFYVDEDAFEAAFDSGELMGGASVVIGTDPMNIMYDEAFIGSESKEEIYYYFSMTETRQDELAQEFYLRAYNDSCEFESEYALENNGVEVGDFEGYYRDIRNFVLKSGGDPNLLVQFHNEEHFRQARDRSAVKMGTYVVIGEGPEEALVFPYVSNSNKALSTEPERLQAQQWLSVRDERLANYRES